LNVLHRNEIETAKPAIGSRDLSQQGIRHQHGRRTTDLPRSPDHHGATGMWQARRELIEGLNAPHASIPAKYFYDQLGSRLFGVITKLPEYYLTRAEAAIFSSNMGQIAQRVGRGRVLIDLGAGDCEKAASLFGALRPHHYFAVDISADYLETALDRLRQQFPDIAMTGLASDMFSDLSLPDSVPCAGRLFFYPGSSIGNLTPAAATAFLVELRQLCQQDGGLLIGVDLVKPKSIIDAAYDDALGVTAAFNLNVLNNVNSELGANFDVRDWQHRGYYNQTLSRAEMHLEARLPVDVRWPGGSRRFETGERIHTENSYKYDIEEFRALLQRAGFGDITVWTEQRGWFALYHATP
jgi:dimethylhistidine N-methyltransferase